MAVQRIYLVKSLLNGKSKLSEAFDKDHARNKELCFFPGHSINQLKAKKVYDKNQKFA